MKIISDDKESELFIESCRAEIACYPSFCLNLQLKTEEASGKRHEVWIAEDEMYYFLGQLKILDATRKGKATLNSMTPNGFAITLFPLDSLGHIGLKATMQSRKYRAGGKFLEFSVEGAFEIDATSIPRIIADFNELIDEQRERTS